MMSRTRRGRRFFGSGRTDLFVTYEFVMRLPRSGEQLRSFLSFDPSNRVLTYTNPEPPPVLGTPNTYRYLVGTEASVDATNADDALCLDVQYNANDVDDICPDDTYIHILLQVRDDAFWDENAEEYRCPDTTAPLPRPGAQGSPSNPVHEALGPVHARRASAVAHAAVRDRVREWSPGAEQASFAIAPEVGLASLSGQSEGFDYSGTSESASFGAETGAGAWQAGLVASVTNTELHYRAEAVLAAQGYRTGEHDTEILSLHPFAAWHAPSGGHFWASIGAGAGSLSHRDDLGFRSWSRSDVRLFAYAVGASVPVADVLSGELQAEAGIESFAFDIKGGGRISSSLPTFRGRDYRAGLAWSASVTGAPSLSVAYKHLTGDGPEGGQLEARGSVSVAGIFDPRLTVIGNAEGSFGLGDYEHDSWGLGGVNGGVKPRINGEQRVAEATTCRVERQGVASRQAALRLLRCAPALRATRRNPLTQLAFMAGSRLPAVNDPLCENTAIQKVNPHILCSPLFGAFGSPSTRGRRALRTQRRISRFRSGLRHTSGVSRRWRVVRCRYTRRGWLRSVGWAFLRNRSALCRLDPSFQ